MYNMYKITWDMAYGMDSGFTRLRVLLVRYKNYNISYIMNENVQYVTFSYTSSPQ